MVDGTLSLLLTFVAFTLSFFVILDLFKKRRILLFSSQHKGHRFYPVIGNGYHFLEQDIVTNVIKLADTYKLPCNLWTGHDYMYVTADPAEIKLVLNDESTTEKAAHYKSLKVMIGENTLLIEPFDEWRKDRKLFSKSFSPRILSSLVDLSYKKSFWLVEKCRESHTKLSLETLEVFTLSIITDSFAGQEGQLTINECYGIAKKLQIVEEAIGKRFLDENYYPNILFACTQEGRSVKKCFEEILEALNKVIQNKRENLSKIESYSVTLDDLPLIEQLMRNEEKFSDDKIFRNILLFFLASIHTSATSLLSIFTLLGMHSEIQEKVYREVIDTVGLTNPITYRDLPNLKYTEMVISECLRMLPTIPTIGRYVFQDLNLGTKTLPAGSNVLVSILHLHRDEKLWKDPLTFDPDRFLPEEIAKRHPYSYIPFSAGPKNCIGMKYAMLVLKATVANVIRNHQIHCNYKSVKDMQLGGAIVIKTPSDLECRTTPRKG